VKVRDIVIGQAACTNSNFASQYQLPGQFAPIADFGLLRKAVEVAERQGSHVVVGNVLSSDAFYSADKAAGDAWKRMGVTCIEMEAAALYMNAAYAGKKALCILTISDHIYTGESLPAQERQTSFREMIEIALQLA